MMSEVTGHQAAPWPQNVGEACGIVEYDRNPFINCLPPPPSEKDCFRHLLSAPTCTDGERLLAPHLREQLTFIRIKQAFFPTGAQVRQAAKFDMLLRAGYVLRDPSLGLFQRQMTALAAAQTDDELINAIERLKCAGMVAESMAVLGPSGIGKTTTIKRTLAAYPQVIEHNDEMVGTMKQIVWLCVEAASDGSTKQTILSMFAAIDKLIETKYAQKYGGLVREKLLVQANQICARHAIGLIVVDEIQNLKNSSAGESDLMSFLTSLVNVINVPIMLIGTMKAYTMMTGSFRTGRRGEGGGGSIVYEAMPLDGEWRTFVAQLFRYQWTTKPTELTDDIVDALWEESQGLIDIAVKLYTLSQMRAIRVGAKGGDETISVDLVRHVAKENLKLVRPMLEALRNKDWKSLEQYDDLGSLDAMIATQLQKAWQCAAGDVDLNSLAAEISARIDTPDGEVANGLLAGALAANGLDGAQLAQIMAAVASLRAEPNVIAATDTAAALTPKRSALKRVQSEPTDPQDIRRVKGAADPLKALAELGLVEAA